MIEEDEDLGLKGMGEDSKSESRGKASEKEETVEVKSSDLKALLSRIESLENQKTAVSPSGDISQFMNAMNSMNKQGAQKLFDDNNQFIFSPEDAHDASEEDVLPQDEWRAFVCYRVGHFVPGDSKNGRPIKAPYNPIVFNFAQRKISKNGDSDSVLYISTYICKSKKELEFLLNHSRFGLDFFDRIDKNYSDASKATRLAQLVTSMKNKNQFDLRKMCQDYNLPFTEDLTEVRAMIASRVMELEESKKNDYSQSAANNLLLEKKLVDKT